MLNQQTFYNGVGPVKCLFEDTTTPASRDQFNGAQGVHRRPLTPLPACHPAWLGEASRLLPRDSSASMLLPPPQNWGVGSDLRVIRGSMVPSFSIGGVWTRLTDRPFHLQDIPSR